MEYMGGKWARQDLRARLNTYHPSLNPDVKGGGANLQPVTWRITALFQLGYKINLIVYRLS